MGSRKGGYRSVLPPPLPPPPVERIECYNNNHQLIQKTKVYLRVPDDCGRVWFEVDLGAAAAAGGEKKKNEMIKVRRMEWVAPDQGKPSCTVVSVGSSIYLLGGGTSIRYTDVCYADVFYFDATNNLYGKNECKAAPKMSRGRETPHVAVYQGKIYVFSFGEFFDPKNPLWKPFQGPSFNPNLECAAKSYSDPSNDRILVYFCMCYDTPLCEYRPDDDSWICLNPKFNFFSATDLSVLVGDAIIAHRVNTPDFVAYDLVKHEWSPVVWASGRKFGAKLFKEFEYWGTLLHLGNGTLLMGRYRRHGRWRGIDHTTIHLDCLTFRVQKKSDGIMLASAPSVKSVIIKGAYCVEDYILL